MVELDAYAAAQPDAVIAQSLRIRNHLNNDHADDLVILASRLFGTPRRELAAVTVEWIDALGLTSATSTSRARRPYGCRSGRR